MVMDQIYSGDTDFALKGDSRDTDKREIKNSYLGQNKRFFSPFSEGNKCDYKSKEHKTQNFFLEDNKNV